MASLLDAFDDAAGISDSKNQSNVKPKGKTASLVDAFDDGASLHSYGKPTVQAAAQPASLPAQSQADQIPGGGVSGSRNVGQPDNESWWEKVKGAGQAAWATADNMVKAPVAAIAGAVKTVTGGNFGTQAGIKQGQDYADSLLKDAYQPTSAAGQRYAENIGKAMSPLAAIAPLSEMQAIGNYAKPTLQMEAREIGSRIPIRNITQATTDAPRIEPTLAKPRFKLQDGQPVPIANDAAPQLSASGKPTLADTPPGFQTAVKDAANTPALQRHIEAQSLPVPVDLTDGQASGNIHQISFEQNNRGAHPALGDFLNAQNPKLIQNLDAIKNTVAPNVNAAGTALDQAVVDSYKKIDAPIVADISAKYQALKDANGGQFPLQGKDFVSSADAALKEGNVTRFLPAEVKGILEDHRDGGPMTYNDFENYRTILAQQARKAERAGDGTAAHAIGVVRNSLESLPMSEETTQIKPLADAARSAAKARFDKIASDPAYKAAINDDAALGEPSPIADKFINKYVINGKTANVKTMLENLSGDPLAKEHIAAGVVDHVKSQSGIDTRTNAGNLSQSGLNKAILALDQKKALILDSKSAQQLEALGNVARYTQEQPRGAYVNNSNTLTGALATGAKDLVNGALDVKTLGATKFIRNQMAKRGQAKAVENALKPGAGTTKLSDFP